jgi:hypothetical protein
MTTTETLAGQVGVLYHPRPGTFGALVSAVTKSPAFHIVVAISDQACMSPESEGVLVRTLDHFDGYDIVWSRFDYTDEQRRAIVDWVTARRNKPYAWLDDAIIAVKVLTGWRIPPWIAERLSRDDWYQCSELAACALFYGAGIRIFPGLYPGETSPRDFDLYFQEQGWVDGDGNGLDQGVMCSVWGSQALAGQAGH